MYSRSIPIVFFVDDILVEKEGGKESLKLLSTRNSPCLEQFNIIGYSVVWFPLLVERRYAELWRSDVDVTVRIIVGVYLEHGGEE